MASKQESCRDSMPSSLWHQIWAVWLQQVYRRRYESRRSSKPKLH